MIDSERLPVTPPAGEVTLLFTDVEGSTRLWELHGDRMLPLLAEHDRIVARAVEDAGGLLQRNRAEGDSSFAVFADASAAIRAAIGLQRAMASYPWPEDLRIRTRGALHTGTVELRGDTYYGPVVNRCVKLRSLAHGGQTILSKSTVNAAIAAGGLPADASAIDMGTHRLKDLLVPERVYELRHPDLAGGFPPLRSADAEKHNLPDLHGRLVGRSEDRVAVATALDEARLVTLAGAGGVGKTRLALEVAWDRVVKSTAPGAEAPDHDGTWFADLTGARTADDVDGVLATAIGVREQPGRRLLETIIDHLGDHRSLVVLDNCEHVVPIARRLVEALLDRCPEVRVLATSREALGLSDERQRAVPGLPLDDAVELFADRSGLGLASADPETVSTIQRLCRRLDGIPLAIEIAAARAAAIGPVAVDLGVAEAQIEEAGRSVLEATLAWSHDLLAPVEQVLFRRLGIFAGPFTIDGAEAVVSDDAIDAADVLDLVAALVERSLVQRTDGGTYRQLVAVREYAATRADQACEYEALAARHLSWCLAIALGAQDSGLDVGDRLDSLRLVSDDLLAALDRQFTEDLASQQVQLASALEEFWYSRGAYTEGRAHLEAVLARGSGFRSNRAAVHRSAGYLAQCQGDLAVAAGHLESSRLLWEETLGELRAAGSPLVPNFEHHLAVTLIDLSEVNRLRGEPRTAADLAGEALALAGPTAAVACLQLGLTERAQGRAEEAQRRIVQAIEMATRDGQKVVIADCRRNLGVFARADGDLASAEAHYQEALAIDRRSGTEQLIAHTLLSLADLRALAGDDASAALEEGLSLARSLGDRSAEAHGLSTLGDITAATDLTAAATMHRTALDLRTAVGAPAEEALSLVRVASFAEVAGQFDEAAAQSSAAADLFRRLGDHRGVTEALALLARVEVRRSDTNAAAAALKEALERSERVPTLLEWADVLDGGAWLAAALGRFEDASELLASAGEHRRRVGMATLVPCLAAQAALSARLADPRPEPGVSVDHADIALASLLAWCDGRHVV